MLSLAGKRVVLVTGRLAAPSLSPVAARLAERVGFIFELFVAKISVAALMTTEWLVGKLQVPPGTDFILLPGLCQGDLEVLRQSLGVAVVRGPEDLRDLPEFLEQPDPAEDSYGVFDLEILAEINHANRLEMPVLLQQAARYRDRGADVIDLGCTPGERWEGIGTAVATLVGESFRVSVDSFDAGEVADAARAGAELVLSVNGSNCARARDWGCPVVVIPDRPDEPDWLDSLARSVERLEHDGVRYRLDPILEPIGMGFAASLGRYLDTRRRFPSAAMLMGVGNLTELTAADSAGINALLAGFCQELGIGSVLTTEVAHWAAGAVGELDVARRLMKYAVDHHTLPKRRDSRLVMLRAGRPKPFAIDELRRLQSQLTDRNYRIFADDSGITVLNADTLVQSPDPIAAFERLGVADPSHAFYLGWELMKAWTACQLGKEYVQDRALRWGLLTEEERGRHDRGRTGAGE